MSNKCVIKCNPYGNLASGYTRVRVMPENYQSILMISGITQKTIQDVVDELLSFAIQNVEIIQNDGKSVAINVEKAGCER